MSALGCRYAGALLCAAAQLGGTSPALAQVNVEPLRQQLPEHGFGARLGASATSYAGNTQGVVLGASGLVGFRSARHAMYATTSGNYARLDGTISIANWFGHMRHNYALRSRVWWEEFGQLEGDRFRRITLRELLGTGPRFQLLAEESLELFYGAAYMYEYTHLAGTDQTGPSGGGAHRFSNYLAATLRAHPKILLTCVTYAQPRFDAPSDLRILSISNVSFEVTSRLHSRLHAKVRHDSRPPSEVEATDLELSSSIELLF